MWPRPSPAKSRIFERVPDIKVFWFFSSEKNKNLLFLKKNKQKDFVSGNAARSVSSMQC
jgi:hypothetical protein